MYFVYGNYKHEDHECMVTSFTATRIYNRMGQSEIIRRRMTIAGEIVGADAAAIDERVRQIRLAYTLQGGYAAMFHQSGVPSYLEMPSAGSLSGVRVVEGPTFMQQDKAAHYVTGLPFTVTLECDYVDGGAINYLVDYRERVSMSGTGGPRRITFEVDSGRPIEQVTSTNTPVTMVQEGYAVGMTGWPEPNQCYAPTQLDLPEGYQVSFETPQRHANGWLDYRTSWSYHCTFVESPGFPTPLLRYTSGGTILR